MINGNALNPVGKWVNMFIISCICICNQKHFWCHFLFEFSCGFSFWSTVFKCCTCFVELVIYFHNLLMFIWKCFLHVAVRWALRATVPFLTFQLLLLCFVTVWNLMWILVCRVIKICSKSTCSSKLNFSQRRKLMKHVTLVWACLMYVSMYMLIKLVQLLEQLFPVCGNTSAYFSKCPYLFSITTCANSKYILKSNTHQ